MWLPLFLIIGILGLRAVRGIKGDHHTHESYQELFESTAPTISPTIEIPSLTPSPSYLPSGAPSSTPTIPTFVLSKKPSHQTQVPTRKPSRPTKSPTLRPTGIPLTVSTISPSFVPTTSVPSHIPSGIPSLTPTTSKPSRPTFVPSRKPSRPTQVPTRKPSRPTKSPTLRPTGVPSIFPTGSPTFCPTSSPSPTPSSQPSAGPTSTPSDNPSMIPSGQPSTQPSGQPTAQPISQPSGQPISQPSGQPSAQPSSQPSFGPLHGLISVRIQSLSFPKLNLDSSLHLTGLVQSNVSCFADWSALNPLVHLHSISLTNDLGLHLSPGANSFPLLIKAGGLEAGPAEYTFRLTAYYGSSFVSSEISVRVNQPPSNGTFSVAPSNGTGLVTVFSFLAPQWTDEDSDYPLTYSFARADLTSGDVVYIAFNSTNSSVASTLSSGRASDSYSVVMRCLVYDALGSQSESAATVLTVAPIADAAVRASTIIGQLQSLSGAESDKVIQATAAEASTTNCSTPFSCSALNRAPCSSLPNTCGACLSGFVGYPPVGNTACTEPALVVGLGGSCADSSQCICGKCLSGHCAAALKACPNECSGRGNCTYVNAKGSVVPACLATDVWCDAKCFCPVGFYGTDCALGSQDFSAAVAVTESLCLALNKTSSSNPFVNSNSLKQRTLVVLALFQDMTTVTETALFACTSALLTTLSAAPAQSITDPDTLKALMTAFSVISSSALVGRFSGSVDGAVFAIMETVASASVSGTNATTLWTSTLRLASIKLRSDELDGFTMQMPQPLYETFLMLPSPSVSLNASGGLLDLSLALTQKLRDESFDNLTSSTILIRLESTAAVTRRRLLLQDHLSPISIVLYNDQPQSYTSAAPQSSFVSCNGSKEYDVSVVCGDKTHGVHCNASRYDFKYDCATSTAPSCELLSSSGSAVECAVTAFDARSTTCACWLNGRRRLSDSSNSSVSGDAGVLFSVASSLNIVQTSFVSHILYVGEISADDIEGNIIIVVTTGVLLAAALLGAVVFGISDSRHLDSVASKSKGLASRTMHSFFTSVLPHEYHDSPWWGRLSHKLFEEHEWLKIIVPYKVNDGFKCTAWLLAIGKPINRFFVMTLLSSLYFVNDHSCDAFTTEATCLSTRNLDIVDHLCAWEEGACHYHSIHPTFLPLFVLSTVICLVIIPLDYLYEYMVKKIQHFADDKASLLRLGEDDVDLESSRFSTDLDELQAFRKPALDIMLAARVSKMKEHMDEVSVVEETRLLKSNVKRDDLHQRTASMKTLRGQTKNFFLLHLNENADPRSISNLIHMESDHLIRLRLQRARDRADIIVKNLHSFKTPEQQEVYLVQRFLVDSLRGLVREVVYNYFFGEFDAKEQTKNVFAHYACMVAVPLYLIALVAYVFIFGLSLPQPLATFWIIEIIIVLIISILILDPLVITLKFLIVTTASRKDVLALYYVLKNRGASILRRKTGLMNTTHALLHHFNPACRAAREFPHLPAAKLLVSLNDFDLPSAYEINESPSAPERFRQLGFSVAVFFICLLAYFPYFIQNALIETFAISSFYGGVLGFYALATVNIVIPIVLGLSIGAMICMYYYFKSRSLKDDEHEEGIAVAVALITSADKYEGEEVVVDVEEVHAVTPAIEIGSIRPFQHNRPNSEKQVSTHFERLPASVSQDVHALDEASLSRESECGYDDSDEDVVSVDSNIEISLDNETHNTNIAKESERTEM